MLDFSRLKAPAGHGEVLVAPGPQQLVASVRHNRARLDECRALIAGVELRELRRATRLQLVGDEQRLVIVTGHQPEFMHAGVWAKNVVAERLARWLGGHALNLVVDNDAPSSTDLLVPEVGGGSVRVRRIPSTSARGGLPYESLPALSADEVRRFEREVHEGLGDRYERSFMPVYVDALRNSSSAHDWVEQTLAGRHAVENVPGVYLRDVRVSEAWWSPLLAELLLHAPQFAATYNRALSAYRREYKLRGESRPIPDLFISDARVEIPVWAFREAGPRLRVFLERAGDKLRLFAGETSIGELMRSDVETRADLVQHIAHVRGWRIRPRALTLTMWARLLFADLFIHGIGGAKYDRITDQIIRAYFGIEPPAMACVTATMRLKIAGHSESDSPENAGRLVRENKQALRELFWNPQIGGNHSPPLEPLRLERQELVETSTSLREHSPRQHQARREVFRRLRDVIEQLRGARAKDIEQAGAELHLAEQRAAQAKIMSSREYFFALLERAELERLLAALPGERDFGV